jgi:hypothetical protein
MEVTDFFQLIPKDLMKIGCGSLMTIAESHLHSEIVETLNQKAKNFNEDFKSDLGFKDEPLKLIKLQPISTETPVFGVDTSNIELGETSEGILSATRGTIVWIEKGAYHYIRYGPFVFHITETNKQHLCGTLHQAYFNNNVTVGTPTIEKMPEYIRNIFERWLQKLTCNSSEDSLILFDGSLTSRAAHGSVPVLEKLLRNARSRQNVVLAFSKKTNLSVSGCRVSDLIENKHAPCLKRLDDYVISQYNSAFHFLGRIYAAKLLPSYFTFRLDIDRKISELEGIQAVQKLLGSDLIVNNYPETLRLAHIMSRFSAGEVIAIQRYVTEKYNLKILCRPDVRRVLFGSYGHFAYA